MDHISAITLMSQIEPPAIEGFDILAIVYHYYAISGVDGRTNGKKEKNNKSKSNNSYEKVSHISIGSIFGGRDLD